VWDRIKRNAAWLTPALLSVVFFGEAYQRSSAGGLGWMGWSYLGMGLGSAVVGGLVLVGRSGTRNDAVEPGPKAR
jgi:hypothetical protein